MGYVAPKNPVEQPKPCSQRNQKQWMTVFLPLRGVRVCYVVIRGLWFCQLKVFFRFISHLDLGAGSKKKHDKNKQINNNLISVLQNSFTVLDRKEGWFMPGAFMRPTTLRPVLPRILFPRQQYPRQVLYMFAMPVKLNSSQRTGMLAVKTGMPLLSATSVLIHCPKQYWSLSCR